MHGETIDTHFMRSTRFYDTLGGSGGIVWNVGITLMYYPVRLRHLGVFLRGSYGAIAGLTGTTSSGAIGFDDGTLVIDRGYGSKMEQHTGGVSLGIVLQVLP